MEKRNTRKRPYAALVSAVLAFVLLLGLVPLSAFAEEGEAGSQPSSILEPESPDGEEDEDASFIEDESSLLPEEETEEEPETEDEAEAQAEEETQEEIILPQQPEKKAVQEPAAKMPTGLVQPMGGVLDSIFDADEIRLESELESALAALGSGDSAELVLMDNITLTKTHTIPAGATVALYNDAAYEIIHAGNGLRHFVVEGTLVMDGAVLSGNISTSVGGGVVVADGGSLWLESGSIQNSFYPATVYGAGVEVQSGASFTMNGGEVANNRTSLADSFGGGVYVAGGASFTLNSGDIAGNKANHGGGVYAADSSTFTMQGGNITDNGFDTLVTSDTYLGGGLYAGDVNLSLTGGSIENNFMLSSSSGSKGGGIYLAGGSAYEIGAISISEYNTANTGGGIYFASTNPAATLTLQGTTLDKNRGDSGGGGGIYAEGARLTLNNTTLTYNAATGTETVGGIYVVDGALTLNNSLLEHNSNNGARSAGAILTVNSELVLDKTTVQYNGGTYVAGLLVFGGTYEIKNESMFYVNNNGGMVALDSEGTIDNSTFDYNNSYGIRLSTTTKPNTTPSTHETYRGGRYSSSLEITNSTISRNMGGGIYADSDAGATGRYLRMDNCEITDNKGTGVYNICLDFTEAKITNSQFTDNQIPGFGGALMLAVNSEVENCSFVGNSSVMMGGAIFHVGEDLKIKDCLFENNTAQEGGAIYTAFYNTLWLDGVTFWNNKATGNGPILMPVGHALRNTHETNVTNLQSLSLPFEVEHLDEKLNFAYNNYDVYHTGTKVNIRTVTFDPDGGLPDPGVYQIQHDSHIPEPPEPKKDGYAFDGWYIDVNTPGTKWNFDTKTVTSDITLTAKWVEEYTVSFDINYTGGTNPADQKVRLGGKASEPTPTPSRNGFDFDGWYTDVNDETTKWDFITNTVTGDVQLIAKWIQKHTVSFDINYVGGTNPASQTVRTGKLATEPSPAPSRSGHAFDGWYTDVNDENTKWDFGTDTVTSDVALVAKWTKTYTVSFDINYVGGTNPASQTVRTGKFATAPSPTPSRADYDFDGWYTDVDDETTKWDFATPITEDVALVAKWTQTHTVSFTINYAGGTDPADQTVRTGKFATEPSPEPYRDGYKFLGWQTAEGLVWDFDTMPVTRDEALRAGWAQYHTVTLHPNVGSAYTQRVAAGEKIAEPASTEATGFTSVGWYTKSSGGSRWSFGTGLMPDNDLHLYEQQKNIVYVATYYDTAGGAKQTRNQHYGDKLENLSPTSTPTGKEFVAWQVQGTNKVWDFAKDTMPAGDITLVATWKDALIPDVVPPVSEPDPEPEPEPSTPDGGGEETPSTPAASGAASRATTSSTSTSTSGSSSTSSEGTAPAGGEGGTGENGAGGAGSGGEAGGESGATLPEDAQPVQLDGADAENGSLNLFGNDVPLGGLTSGAGWSLVNLILCILAFAGSAFLTVRNLLAKKKQAQHRIEDDEFLEPENDGAKAPGSRKYLLGWLAALAGLLPTICFIGLENFSQMQLLSRWTPLIVILCCVQIALVVVDKVKNTITIKL